MAEQRNTNQNQTNRNQNQSSAGQSTGQGGAANQTNHERTRARERSMDDPTRGRQGDPLEEELPHGRSDQSDRMSER